MTREHRLLIRDLVALGRQLERAADQIAQSAIDPSIGYTDALVLGALDTQFGGTGRPKDLVYPLLTTPAGISGSLKRLEKAGLVERTHSETDRRAVYVSLTSKGRAITRKATVAYDTWVEDLVGEIPSPEIASLREFIDRQSLPQHESTNSEPSTEQPK